MRHNRTLTVQLRQADRDELNGLLRGGIQPVRTVLRALALTHLDAGQPVASVAGMVHLTPKAVREIGRRYEDLGLEHAIHDKPRPGAARVLTDRQRRSVLKMVGGNPPPGFSRWTVRLAAREAVRRKLVAKIGREAIRVLLLKAQ